MIVLAIGDTHLRAGERRQPVRLRALDQILAHATAQHDAGRLAAILWPGDLFHAESTIADRNLLAVYVQAFANLAPLVIVRGNHDKPGDLDIFSRLRTAHQVHVVTTPCVHVIGARAKVLAVACLPHPETSALVAANLPPAEMGPAVGRAFDALFLQMGQELSQQIAIGVPTIFAGHVTISGAELSVGQPLIGHDLAIDATHLARLPQQTVRVLNHIHKPQEIHGAHYTGSIAAVDFGEVERKRFLELVHVDGQWRVTSIPLDVPAMYHVDGHVVGDAFDWRVTKGPDGPVSDAPASWAGTEVRVRYRFAAADAGRLDLVKAQIFAEFAEAAHVELEPVAIAERAVRAPEVVQALTLADKVAAWAATAGVTASDGVRAKLARLESTDPALLLAEIEASLRRSMREGAKVAA